MTRRIRSYSYDNRTGNIKFQPGGGFGTITTEEALTIAENGEFTANKIPYTIAARTSSTVYLESSAVCVFQTEISGSGHYNTSNGKFTVPIAGKYWCSHDGLVDGGSNTGNQGDTRWLVNGVNSQMAGYASNMSQSYEKTCNQCILKLEVDDYVQLGGTGWRVYQSSTSYHNRIVIFYIG